ncbi:hypothetical protein T484DRAFT_1885356, partial [Baffinella frigidus]
MRGAGAVRAAERAAGETPTEAGAVYAAVAAEQGNRLNESSLAAERRKAREEAKRAAEEGVEALRAAEEQTRKEKFRGAKEEADRIRARLRELEARKKAARQATKEAEASLEEEEAARAREEEGVADAPAAEGGENRAGASGADAETRSALSAGGDAAVLLKAEIEAARARAGVADANLRAAEEEARSRPGTAGSSGGDQQGVGWGDRERETRTRVEDAEREAARAQQEVARVQGAEELLRSEMQREAEARRAAQGTAVEALQEVQRLQALSRQPAPLSPTAAPRPASAQQLQREQGSPAGEQHQRPATAAPPRPSALAVVGGLADGLLSWAAELGHTVVSPVTVSPSNLTNMSITPSASPSVASPTPLTSIQSRGGPGEAPGSARGTSSLSVLSELSAGGASAGGERHLAPDSPARSSAGPHGAGGSEGARGGVGESVGSLGGTLRQESEVVGGQSGPEVFGVETHAGELEDDSIVEDVSLDDSLPPRPGTGQSWGGGASARQGWKVRASSEQEAGARTDVASSQADTLLHEDTPGSRPGTAFRGLQ